ncbi:PTS transporter subunit EIIA, partial [Bifidobacterium pseudocatenulatum]|nr:PTS transporter subunit EIIA [Bifidobacterium pseudocatenulatum]
MGVKNETEFSIADVITEELIYLEMKAKTKEEVIRELSELLEKNGSITNVDEFLKDVFQREKEGMTGIGNG